MPHTPETLFGKPPLSVSSPLSSLGWKRAVGWGKNQGLASSFTYGPCWAVSLLGIRNLCLPPSPPHHKHRRHPAFGKRFFLRKEFRSFFWLTCGMYSRALQVV